VAGMGTAVWGSFQVSGRNGWSGRRVGRQQPGTPANAANVANPKNGRDCRVPLGGSPEPSLPPSVRECRQGLSHAFEFGS